MTIPLTHILWIIFGFVITKPYTDAHPAHPLADIRDTSLWEKDSQRLLSWHRGG